MVIRARSGPAEQLTTISEAHESCSIIMDNSRRVKPSWEPRRPMHGSGIGCQDRLRSYSGIVSANEKLMGAAPSLLIARV